MPFLAFFTFSLQDRRNFVDVFYAQSLGGYFSEIQVLLKFEMTWNAVSHLRPSQPMMGKELLNWWCRDSGTSKLLYAVLIASKCDHLVILRSVMYQHFNHEFASIFIDTKLTSSLEEEPANVCSRRSRGGWLKSKDALFVQLVWRAAWQNKVERTPGDRSLVRGFFARRTGALNSSWISFSLLSWDEQVQGNEDEFVVLSTEWRSHRGLAKCGPTRLAHTLHILHQGQRWSACEWSVRHGIFPWEGAFARCHHCHFGWP